MESLYAHTDTLQSHRSSKQQFTLCISFFIRCQTFQTFSSLKRLPKLCCFSNPHSTFSKQLLGFTDQISVFKVIKEEVFSKVIAKISSFEPIEISRFNKYVLKYAKNDNINERSRTQFYLLSEHIENVVILRGLANPNVENVFTDSELTSLSSSFIDPHPSAQPKDFVIGEDEEPQGQLQPEQNELLSGDESEADDNAVRELNGILGYDDIAEAIADNIEEDAIRQGFVNDGQLRMFSDANQRVEEPLEEEEMEVLMPEDEDLKDSDFEDDDEVPEESMENLTKEQLKKRVPPYYFMSNKKKKKFFKRVNENFQNKIQSRKIKKPNAKVDFDLDTNQVKTFVRNQRVVQ